MDINENEEQFEELEPLADTAELAVDPVEDDQAVDVEEPVSETEGDLPAEDDLVQEEHVDGEIPEEVVEELASAEVLEDPEPVGELEDESEESDEPVEELEEESEESDEPVEDLEEQSEESDEPVEDPEEEPEESDEPVEDPEEEPEESVEPIEDLESEPVLSDEPVLQDLTAEVEVTDEEEPAELPVEDEVFGEIDVYPEADAVDDPYKKRLLEIEPAIDDGRAWYVVHCYSGNEDKVRHNILQRIESMTMDDLIFDVVVPTEDEVNIKNGERQTVEKKVFPGYILVNMILTEESWYMVRNTPGVTGFVGMGNDPTALQPEEVARILKRMESESPRINVTFRPGERVRIVDGPFEDFYGKVSEIDMDRATVRVMVNFFGRETPVELDFLQVEEA